MKLIALVFFAFVNLYSLGQEPAFVSFAEKEFRGIDIYDVIQDDLNNYWFATNRGLRMHDGYSFVTISCEEMKSQSVFRFVKDGLGRIYCFNLQHQIFRIDHGEISLFYEVPEAYGFHEMDILTDAENHLLIQSKGLIRISPDKKEIKIVKEEIFTESKTLSLALLKDGSSISTSRNNMYAIQKDGKISERIKLQFENPAYSGLNIFNWFRIGDKLYGLNSKTMDVFLFREANQTLQHVATLDQSLTNSVNRVYVTAQHVWVSGMSNGIHVYDHTFQPMYNGKRACSDHFVSDIYTDHEGNILLSTFDEGVKVIFNVDILGFELKHGENANHICSSEKTLFITTNQGNVYALTDGIAKRIYFDPLQQEIEVAFYWKARDLLFLATGTGLVILKWDGENLIKRHVISGSFKDAFFSDDNTALLAFNFGVEEIIFSNETDFIQRSLFSGRSYCVGQDQRTNAVYIGASKGLLKTRADGILVPVKFRGEIVSTIATTHHGDRLFMGTRKQGILIVQNGKITQQIPFEGTIRSIHYYDESLFALTNRGLFRVRTDGSQKEQLNKANGLFFEYVSSFHIANDKLYVTNSKSIEFIGLDQLTSLPNKIPIRFTKITVNDAKIDTKLLAYNAKNIQFSLGVSTLKYRENVRYKFRLKGFNNKWKYAPYNENTVNYTTLPPGEYTFESIAVNGTTESEPISYTFSIDAPYYQKWWFYLLLLLASGLLIALLFSQRIRVIRKKNRERMEKQQIQSDMLESELKALRSQMNPHFIFNSLNSIQDLILQEETDASYDYIVLFAELVRSALNYSNKDFIPIGKEIEFIDVYLQLEKLRFKENFEYTIECNVPDFLNVPSMLIQPFIENALLHGLLHKSGKKRLLIRFEFDEKLICQIEDNGIGREKAAEIQNRQGPKHEPFALKAIDKRLKILNEKLGTTQGKYTIEDLDQNSTSPGTRVIVQLPFTRDY